MKKRLLSIFLVIAMILTLMPDNLVYGADFGETGDPIVEGSAAIDILINAGTDSEVLAGDLQDKLYKKLKELLGDEELDVNVRINTPSIDLDTSVLSDWYVYDHYDVQYYLSGNTNTKVGSTLTISGNNLSNTNVTAAYNVWKAKSDTDGYKESLRPWFPINATTASTAPAMPATIELPDSLEYSNGRMPKMTVADWVDRTHKDEYTHTTTPIPTPTIGPVKVKPDGRPHNNSSGPITIDGDKYLVDSLGVFDKHIYNHSIDGVAYMDFVGYYTGVYTDFAFFPCPSKETKRVTFDIDGSGVNAHSLNGAGFFINAGIDKDGKLIGYYLYYTYHPTNSLNDDGTFTPVNLTLYKLNGDKTATEIHNALGNATGTNAESTTNAPNSIINNSTIIGDPVIIKNNTDIAWDTEMSIRLTITPTSVLVEQKPKNADSDYVEIMEQELVVNSYNGFGPMVHYRQIGHACIRASQFTYSNINMAYINQTDQIFNLLSGANYIQNADLYFIDLTDDGKNRNLNEDGTNAAAYMQAKKIRYITNNPKDKLLNDDEKDSTTGPLGENGLWIDSDDYCDNKNDPIDIDALAQDIANYILSQYDKPDPDYGTNPLPLGAPVALLSLVRDVDSVTTSYIDTVKRELVGAGLDIFGYDIESKPSNGADIVSYHYEITDPKGNKVTFEAPNHDEANEKLITITNDKDEWPAGEYTVSLYVTDKKTDGDTTQTSSTVTVKFQIVEDITPPLVPTVTIDDGKLSFTTSDIDGYGVVGYELVCTPVDNGSFQYSGTEYNDSDEPLVIKTSVSQITESSQASTQTLSNIVLPVGEYTAELIVYDMAGNKTIVKIPNIDYVNEELIGLKPNTIVDGPSTANTNGTVDIDNDWMGDNISYTTTNHVGIGTSTDNEDNGNTTEITIHIPARPETPGPDADHDPQGMTGIDGNGKIGYVNDTMEYKNQSEPLYTPVDEDATIINGLDKTSKYHVRYRAKPGVSFASLHKEVEIRNNTITGNIEAADNEDVSDKNLIVDIVLKQGNEILPGINITTPTTVSGSVVAGYELEDVPPGIYNLVVTVTDEDGNEYITTTVVTVDGDVHKDITTQTSSKNTIVEIKPNTPDIIAGGLPELLNHTQGNNQQGVTEDDLSVVDSGGRLDIVFYAEEFVENDTERKTPVKALMNSAKDDDRIIGLYLDLSLTKYVWHDNTSTSDADEVTILNSTSELVTVYTPIDSTKINSDKIDDLKIYRYINGISTELPKDTADGEYFEVKNNMVIMHVKNFGEYAVAYQDKSVGPVLIKTNKDNEPWNEDEGAPPIMLKGSGTIQHDITNNTLANIPGGTYSICIDGVDTGKTITVRPTANVGNNPATYTENYYTLTLRNEYGINEVSDGDVYLPGTILTIKAAVAAGYVWDGWTAAPDGNYGDLTSSTTEIIMPAHALTLTAYAEYTGKYSVSGTVIDDHGTPIPDAVLELWQGSEMIGITNTDENDSFTFADEYPKGKYNVVIKTKDKNNKEMITTTVIEIDDDDIIVDIKAVTTLENTVAIIDNNAPPIVVGGLPELLEVTPAPGQDGVTKSDKDNVKDGGKLEIVFRGEEIAASSTKYKESIDELMNLASLNDSIIGLYLNLNMTKYVWNKGTNFDSYEAATETTPLFNTPELITVYTPVDDINLLKNQSDFLIYRCIDGNSETLGLGIQNVNNYGEYYEIVDNMVVLHIRNFGEYAIAFQDQATCKANVTVNKDNTLWTEDTPEIILRGSSDYPLTNNTTADIPGGTYKVIVRGEDTGKYITINPSLHTANAATATVDYYTLTLDKDAGIHTLSELVNDGIYLAGTKIAISAAVSSGYEWTDWTADPTGNYGDLNQKNTTIIMPAKSLTLTASTNYTGVYTVGGKIVDEDGNPISEADIELWYGDECLDTTTIADVNGTFVFDKKHPSNQYNIIIKVKDNNSNEIITTTVIEIDEADYHEELAAVTGLKNTQRQIEDTPIKIIEGLPELLNTQPEPDSKDDEIVSPEDEDIIADGGKLEILFVAEEFTEDDLEYKVPLANLMNKSLEDDRIIGLLLELNVTKYVWEYDLVHGTQHFDSYEDADRITPLSQLPALVTISLSLEGYEGLSGRGINTLKIYRYHAGNTDEIYEEFANRNEYGEYFEHDYNNDMIILHVRRFSEYAITYQDPSGMNVTVDVNKDGAPWAEAGQITLVDKSDIHHPISSTPTTVPGGTYKIYRDGQDTGRYATVGTSGINIILDYYTLTVITGTGIASTTGSGIYLEGDEVDITAGLRLSYIWNGWKSDVLGSFSLANTTITMPSQPVTITASASYRGGSGGSGGGGGGINVPNVIIKDYDNGTVTYSPGLPTDGTKVTITVKPDEGYTLDTLVITDHTGQAVSYVDNGDGTYTYTQPVGTAIVNAGFIEIKKTADDNASEDIIIVIDETIDENIDENMDEINTITDDENINEDNVIIDDVIDDADDAKTTEETTEEATEEDNTNKVSDAGLDNEPKTGDNSLPIPVIIMIAALACLIELLLRKKQSSRI